jgi:hypothetical protein
MKEEMQIGLVVPLKLCLFQLTRARTEKTSHGGNVFDV